MPSLSEAPARTRDLRPLNRALYPSATATRQFFSTYNVLKFIFTSAILLLLAAIWNARETLKQSVRLADNLTRELFCFSGSTYTTIYKSCHDNLPLPGVWKNILFCGLFVISSEDSDEEDLLDFDSLDSEDFDSLDSEDFDSLDFDSLQNQIRKNIFCISIRY